MKHLSILLASLLSTLPLHGESGDWHYQWFSVSSPATEGSHWKIRGDGIHEVRPEGFAIVTEDSRSLIYYITAESSQGRWDGTLPQVIEFSAQALAINDRSEAAAHLAVSNGERCVVVLIKSEAPDQYRLEWKDGDARLWVNDQERPELLRNLPANPNHILANSLYFGDESGVAGGTSLWHYLRWKPLQP